VTLVHLMDRLMERQLDEVAAGMLERKLATYGVDILLEAETERVEGEGRVEAVILKDGRRLPADLVVVAIGIRPNAELARAAGLNVGRGIVVGDLLQTSEPGIYAIGECAEHRGVCYGLVEPGYEQARVLAEHLCGGEASYAGSVVSTNLKVSGVHELLVDTPAQILEGEDLRRGVYKKLVVSRDRLRGAVLIGDTLDARWYLELVRGQTDIGALRDGLMFGRAVAERKAA